MYDYLIVGCGFAGSVLAERIASRMNKKVLIVDRRNHIAGNMYDYYSDDGILVHKYGPHIFQTNDKEIYDYLSQFTDWRLYEHKSLSSVEGHLYPFPVNRDTLESYYGIKFTDPGQVQEYFNSVRIHYPDPKNSEEVILSQIGKDLYEKFFRNYIIKQWGRDPREIAPQVTSRIVIRNNREDRYFLSRYQVMPLSGYTRMFERLLDHKNIRILLQTNYKDILEEVKFNRIIYTGPIDEYFDCMYGKLPYRSINFELDTFDFERFQPVGTVNYPNDYDFTRITEFKHLTGQMHYKTAVVKEYPVSDEKGNDKFYPFLTQESLKLYEKYKREAEKLKSVYFCGRLAEYKYFNMDHVVGRALSIFENDL